MACKLDIKQSITNRVVELSKTNSRESVNNMFGVEVIKPSGRVFIPSTLVNQYWNKMPQNVNLSPTLTPTAVTPRIDNLQSANEAEIKRLRQEHSRLKQAANNINPDNVNADTQLAELFRRQQNLQNRIDTLLYRKDAYENYDFDLLEDIFNSDIARLDSLMKEVPDLQEKLRNIKEAQRIVDYYSEIGDFSREENFLFDDTASVPEGLRTFFQNFANTVEPYNAKIAEIQKGIIVDLTKSVPTVDQWLKDKNIELTYEFLTKPVKDKDWLSLQVLSSEDNYGSDQILIIDVLMSMAREYEDAAIKQRREVIEKLDEKIKAIIGKHKNYDVFKQLDESGEFTGNIIMAFAQKYFDTRKAEKSNKYRQLRDLRNKGTLTAAEAKLVKKLSKEIKQWELENEIMLDPRKLPEIKALFPDLVREFDVNISDADRNDYKNSVLRHLSAKSYEKYVEKVTQHIKEYRLLENYMEEWANDDLREFVQSLNLKPGINVNNAVEAMRIWKALHSPFYALIDHNTVLPLTIEVDGQMRTLSEISNIRDSHYRFTEVVPRRTKGRVFESNNVYSVQDTNIDTGFYDSRFTTIENDAALYDFWYFAIHNLSLAKQMMPYRFQQSYQVNSVLYMEKGVMEQITSDGAFNTVYSRAWDGLVKSLTDNDLSTESYEEDPFGGRERNINYNFLGTRQQLEDKLYEKKLIEYFVKNKINAVSVQDARAKGLMTPPVMKDIENLRKEAKKEIAEKASFDLGSVLKFYLGTMVALNHKENILPVLNNIEATIGTIRKAQTNRQGKVMTEKGALKATDLPIVNAIDRVAYQLDVYTGQPVQMIEGTSSKTMLNKEDSEVVKNLEALKETATEEQKKTIQSLIDSYGSKLTGSGTMDTVLSYLRFRGLGWNVSAQVANWSAGYFANFTAAADGRIVKTSALQRAYNIFWHLCMPSFVKSKVNAETSKKIKNLMYKGDFLLDATSEMQKSRFKSDSTLASKLDWLSPYMPTRLTEYMNQGALVVGRLMTVKVPKNDGTMATLFDALDENLNVRPEFSNIAEDYNWNTGSLMAKETTLIRKLIQDVHGDYSEIGRQYAKRKIAGRMAMFFKTWLPNAMKVRFGAEKFDPIYGMETKGRYRSYTPGTAALTGATIGTWIAPGIGCVCAGTKVYTKNGQIKNIEELVKEDGIIGWSGNKAVPENIINFQDTAIKPCVEIITKRGHSIKCSTDHPIVWSTSDNYGEVCKAERGDKRVRFKKWEWKEAGNIKIGEQIAVIKEIPLFGNKSMWEPRLVGMLIGDGNYSNKRVPRYWSLDQELQQYVESKGAVCDEIRISSENKEFKGYSIKDIFNNLKELGIKGQTGVSKTLPFNFWMYDKESIAELIGGLYDTDGCVNVGKDRITVKISQVSENIITSLRDILIRFGIHGSITKTKPITRMYKNRIIATKEHFVLNIKDKESLLTFHKNFKFLIKYKQDKLNLIPEFYKNRKSKYNSSSGVIFDSVAQINDIGHQTIYNLEVDNSHTYIANNIVTHNTAIGYGIGMGVAKLWGNDIHEKNIVEDFKDSFTGLGMLMKRLVYSKLRHFNPAFADKLDTQFGNFSDVDAANLRANFQELQFMLTLLLAYFVAKATLFDDDEDKKNQLVHNYIINQIVKIQGDLMFYTSPQTPGKLMEQLIPVSKLIDQTFGIINSANKAIYNVELQPNEDTFTENLIEFFPKPVPSSKVLERTYNEPSMLKKLFEE